MKLKRKQNDIKETKWNEMNEHAIKTKWNEIKRHDMNEHETKTTWNELKTKRNKNDMKTKLQRT